MAKDGNGKKRKPLTVSKRKSRGLRRPGTKGAFTIIQDLPIIDEIATKIRQGFPPTEIARYIHTLGFMEETSIDAVREQVRRYGLKVMPPADVASVRQSGLVLKAAAQVKEGMDQLKHLEKTAVVQLELIGHFRTVINAIMTDIDEEDPKAFESRERAIQKFMLLGGTSKLISVLESTSKVAVRHAEVQDLLGLSVGDRRDSTAEVNARISEYAQMTFPGDEQAHQVFSDPNSRRKIISILHKVTRQRSLYEPKEGETDVDD